MDDGVIEQLIAIPSKTYLHVRMGKFNMWLD